MNITSIWNCEKTTPRSSEKRYTFENSHWHQRLVKIILFCCLNFVIIPFLSHWLHGWSSGYFQSAQGVRMLSNFLVSYWLCSNSIPLTDAPVSKLSPPSKLTPKISIGSLMIVHAFMLFCPQIEMENFQNSQTWNVCPVCCLCIAHDENLWKYLEKWEVFLIPSQDQEVPAPCICILLSSILKAATLNS